MSINLKKMAQHGMQKIGFTSTSAYSEVLKYTHQVSAAVLEESIRRIKTRYAKKIDVNDGADIGWNAAVSRIVKVMDELKIEILKK